MPEHYKNVKFGTLSDYITPDKFRTIGSDMRDIPMGQTEFAVQIHLKKALRDSLSFKTPWDGIIYGCARDKRDLKKKLSIESDIRLAYIIDWDDKCLMLAELENSDEIPIMYFRSSEVRRLLENCRRAPEQMD